MVAGTRVDLGKNDHDPSLRSLPMSESRTVCGIVYICSFLLGVDQAADLAMVRGRIQTHVNAWLGCQWHR